MRKEMVLVKHS